MFSSRSMAMDHRNMVVDIALDVLKEEHGLDDPNAAMPIVQKMLKTTGSHHGRFKRQLQPTGSHGAPELDCEELNSIVQCDGGQKYRQGKCI